MPELPEVETIARGLHPALRGKRIAGVDVGWHRTVDPRSLSLDLLRGDVVTCVGRIGKFVAVSLASGRTLTVHLRMTGRLLVRGDAAPVPHERLRIAFDDDSALAFADARKFGRVRLVAGDAADALRVGTDPFSPQLDDAAFAALLRGRKTAIKSLLLDQRRLAGVGNIYASEALFRARIRPRRQAGKLTAKQRDALLRALRATLHDAIASRGSSVDDYVDSEGLQGSFQKLLKVYGRAGLPCRRCRTPIRRIVLAQRGTFYCPACQR